MKRVLLLLAFLAAALALLWLFTRGEATTQPIVRSSVDAASPAEPAPASAHIESEAPPAPLEGESAAVPTRVEQASESPAAAPEPPPGPMAEVRGRVVLALTKQPVNSGEARLLFVLPGKEPELPDRSSRDLSNVMRTTKIDAQGRFRFELPVGTYLAGLTVSPPVPTDDDFRRGGSDASILFVMQQKNLIEKLGEAGVELVVEVEPTKELHGLVRDAQTLAPLRGVRIRIAGTGANVPEVYSAVDGRFTLTGIPSKAVKSRRSLHADRSDHLACVVWIEDAQLVDDAPLLLVDLSPGLAISGSVVDMQNRAVRGVSLRFRAVGFEQGVDISSSVFSTNTDDLGEFRYAPVAPCSSLSVEIAAQQVDGCDVLPLQRDLGPLRSHRTDLRFEVQSSGLLEVRAQLAEGTALAPREFHVICTNSQTVEAAGSKAEARLLRVPIGVELVLEAYASGKDEQDPRLFVRGRTTARLAGRGSQSEIRIVLGERGGFTAPPPKSEGPELVLPDEPFLKATVDVQLIDANSGTAIETGRRVSISGGGGSLSSNKVENGWVRVRGRPGKHVLEAEIDGGGHESFELVIPASGYGTAEWRLKVGP